MASLLASENSQRKALNASFELRSYPPGQVTKPSDLALDSESWFPAEVPGTVASAQRRVGKFAYGGEDFDQKDYWYRAKVELPEGGPVFLHFLGLATLAEVFWNDELILCSENMFHEHRVEMKDRVRHGLLSIRFRSVQTALTERKPRPRWRTRLVALQQLRWIRSTLLGRIPAWSPPVPAVGPFRSIEIESHCDFLVENSDIQAEMQGTSACVSAKFLILQQKDRHPDSIQLWIGERNFPLSLQVSAPNQFTAEGKIEYEHPELWWPHTHGEQPLYSLRLELVCQSGSTFLNYGKIGFRSIEIAQVDAGFAILVNKQEIFCRGACWTPTDLISLGTDEERLRQTLGAVQDAGMNMLRIGGTMIYESPLFYQLCDQLGILVWQDFMFANMDYPVDDPKFSKSIVTELEQFLGRTQVSPSLTVLCGNSEIEQQTAMLGLSKEMWSNSFFSNLMPVLCKVLRADVPYWPSSPSGGVLPFQVDAGVSHYYGVGAYQRPLDDARRARVRFTTECLGFSHIPDPLSVERILDDGEMPFIHPKWKARVPRDQGAGWDFEDIRDHYMQQLFELDPRKLRYADSERYLALARVTTGELINRSIAEWRRVGSTCKGALIWLLRDMWLGAGWGLIDADGRPKAAYYFAKRAMAAQTVFLSDEGLNGLDIHLINEKNRPLSAELELKLFKLGNVQLAASKIPLEIAAHSSLLLTAQSLFAHFIDLSYAYRFGPPSHEVAVVSLRNTANGQLLGQDWYFPQHLPSSQHADLEIEAVAEQLDSKLYELTITCKKWAQSLFIEAKSYHIADNYFHAAPDCMYQIRLTGDATAGILMGTVTALNATKSVKIQVRSKN